MNKKFISWVSAVALASSVIVVPISANAAEGDTLISQNFDEAEAPWGAANPYTDGASKDLYVEYVDAPEDAPESVTGKVYNFSTDRGNNGYTKTVSLDATADAPAYNIIFDTYIKNAMIGTYGYENTDDRDPEHYVYRFGFGDGTNNVIEFCVQAGDIYIVSNGTSIDTGIDTGDTGVWVNVNLFADVESKTISGTVGDYELERTAFASTSASTISALLCETVRYDGSHKGYANNYIDNFVVTETAPLTTATYAYTVNAVDESGNVLKALKTGEAAEGITITARCDYALAADGKYYITDTTEKSFTLSEDAQVETVVYKEAKAGVAYDFEDGNVSAVSTNSTMTAAAADDNGSKVLGVTGTSGSSGAPSTAVISLKDVTTDADTFYVNYDSYVPETGRMSIVLLDAETVTAYGDAGIFRQGIIDGNGYRINGVERPAGVATWLHTTVKADLKNGSVTYIVMNRETSDVVASETFSTGVKQLSAMALISWANPSTASIDNITVAAAGEAIAIETLPPEDPATVEGSEIDLLPASDVVKNFETFNAIEDAVEVVLNHSKAKAAKAGTIDTYDADNARGNSIYTSFDILVNAGDKFTLESKGSSDLGATYVFEGLSDGTLLIYGIQNKSDKADYKVDLGSGVCGTWYRVSIEVPQNNNEGATNTGASKVKVSRIDPTDCTKTTDVIAQGEVGSRNLAGKGMTLFNATVSGKPYVDNGVVYLAAQSAGGDTPEPAVATPEPIGTAAGSDVNLVPENARETISTFEAAEGDASAVANHADAKKAVTTAATAINAYSENARGNAIYAAYDVYVTVGSKIAVTPYGDVGKALGSSLILEGLENGTIKMSIPKDSNTTVDVPNDLVHDTWYRVVMEIPQKGTSELTYAENMKYSVYRIDSADPTKTTLAVSADAYGRGLAGDKAKGLSSIGVEVTGDVYIDNGVVYLKKATADTWYRYMLQVTDGVKTVKSIEEVDDPTKTSGKLGTEYYIWNALMQPYVPAAEEETPAE